MKQILKALGALALLSVAMILARTFMTTAPALDVPPFEAMAVDEAAAAAHLAGAAQIQTISHQDPAQNDPAAFQQFSTYLATTFPQVHARLTRETAGDAGLLYTWPGSDPAAAPIILMAHFDVVPVAAGSEGEWAHPPFAGDIADGFIWGRGTLDDKGAVMALFEAAEALLQAGFSPLRTIYFAFGYDEEVGGEHGAKQIAALLAERGVQAEFCLDEGLLITEGIVPGVAVPLAIIGLAEKGYVSLELTVHAEGGHSSNPPQETAIGMLAAAVSRLEKDPFPARLGGPMRDMLQQAAPYMSFPMRLVMSNLWLFGGLVKWQLESTPATAAAIRTTTAPTIFTAGEKENVLPKEAHAVVNFRIMPGETVETVTERVREVIENPRIEISVLPSSNDPSPVSSAGAPAFAMIRTAIQQVFPGTPVTPGIVLGGTDAQHYAAVAKDIYRFLPVRFRSEDVARMHGSNERIAVAAHAAAIRFYAQVIRLANGG